MNELQGTKFVNKWMGKVYALEEEKGKEVVLLKEDGSRITILRSELLFNYRNFMDKDKKHLTK